MKNRNKIIFLILCIAVIIAAGTCFWGRELQKASLASAGLNQDLLTLRQENEQLSNRETLLKEKLSSKSSDSETLESLNKQIEELNTSTTQIKAEINSVTSQITDVKTKTEALQTSLTKLKTGMNPKTVSKKTYKDEALRCPTDLETGRYIAEGTGLIVITSAKNSTRVAEDLSLLETGSYTFNLRDGESIKITGEVTISEVETTSAASDD